MKRRTFMAALTLATALSCMFGSTAFATSADDPVPPAAELTIEDLYADYGVEEERIPTRTRAEETGYYYTTDSNGNRWKRLWSYTYGKWLDPGWTLA